ncbi:hypothetical protein VSK91_18685 [Bacillus swezeyi]
MKSTIAVAVSNYLEAGVLYGCAKVGLLGALSASYRLIRILAF